MFTEITCPLEDIQISTECINAEATVCMPKVAVYQKRCVLSRLLLIFYASTRVLVRPIGLDMGEVGGSIKCDLKSTWHRAPVARSPQGQNRLKPVLGNPPDPPKSKSRCLLNFFFFETARVKIQLKQS